MQSIRKKREHLQKINDTDRQKVSIYMPTHPQSAGGNIQADQIRYKNALQKVSDQLPKHESELHGIVKQLNSLREESEFWRHQSLSLAVFATEDELITLQLPIEVTPITDVSDRFVLSPLLMAENLQLQAMLVDINLQKPRMFKVDINNIHEVASFTPKSLKELMEEDYEHNQQFYSPAGDRKGTPMFHGHGGSDDHAIEEIDIYLRYLVGEINAVTEHSDAPMLLAGEKRRLTQLLALLDTSRVMDTQLKGNYQHCKESELHKITKSILMEKAQTAITESSKEAQKSKLAVKGVPDILKALTRKAVQKLYVPVLRKTSDSVRDGQQTSFIIETDVVNQMEAIIAKTSEQGGSIHPVRVDSLRSVQPHALLRF